MKFLLCLLLALGTPLWGLNLFIDAGPGLPNVLTPGEIALADGQKVSVGYFDAGFDVAAAGGNHFQLQQAWNTLGTLDVRTIFDEPGRFAGQLEIDAQDLIGTQLYFWIVEGSTADTAFQLGSTYHMGLFTTSGTGWTIPAETIPPVLQLTLSTADIDRSIFGGIQPEHLNLVPVPEASSFSWLLLAFFLVLRRRRLRPSA